MNAGGETEEAEMENNIVIKIPNGRNGVSEGGEGGPGSRMRLSRMVRMLRQSSSQGAQARTRVGPGLQEDSGRETSDKISFSFLALTLNTGGLDWTK